MEPEPRLGRLPQVGQSVDRYVVVAEVAHGGMAAVYAARRTVGSFDKLLALKVMLPHLVGEPRFVQMFLDESRIAAHVHHPNVVQVFDVGQLDNTPFLVMEYLRGQSLSRVLRRSAEEGGSELPPEALLGILAAAATGLHAAHTARGADGEPLHVVHRDVSPQNIFVGYDGVVRVVDFGIAAARGRATQTRTGEVKGKLSYMAPEQLRADEGLDHRVDVYALGVIAWEALAGERLFRADNDPDTIWNVLHKEVDPLDALRGDLPLPLVDVVTECLAREPGSRPSTAAELAGRLRSCGLTAWSPEQLRAHMESAFEEERAREAERLASWRAEPTAATEERSEVRSRSTVATPPRRRRLALATAVGAAVLASLGVAGWLAWSSSEASGPRDPAPGRIEVEPPSAPATARAPSVERVPEPPAAPEPSVAAPPESPTSASSPEVGADQATARAARRRARRARRPPDEPAPTPPAAPAIDPALMEIPR